MYMEERQEANFMFSFVNKSHDELKPMEKQFFSPQINGNKGEQMQHDLLEAKEKIQIVPPKGGVAF